MPLEYLKEDLFSLIAVKKALVGVAPPIKHSQSRDGIPREFNPFRKRITELFDHFIQIRNSRRGKRNFDANRFKDGCGD